MEKDWQETNTLAYFVLLSVMKEKGFITMIPDATP
jgi:hypothetical protein